MISIEGRVIDKVDLTFTESTKNTIYPNTHDEKPQLVPVRKDPARLIFLVWYSKALKSTGISIFFQKV